MRTAGKSNCENIWDSLMALNNDIYDHLSGYSTTPSNSPAKYPAKSEYLFAGARKGGRVIAVEDRQPTADSCPRLGVVFR